MFHGSLLGALALTESLDRRERIRHHIRMVMEQLEEVLTELKDVARELREVVAQIDKLTADIDLETGEDTEEHKMTLACSSERALLRVEPFSKNHDLSHLLQNPLRDTAEKQDSALCQRICEDLPALNGSTVYSPNASWLFGSRKMHCCDKTLYHALCCDDDIDEENGGSGRRSSRFSSNDSVFSSSPSRPLRVEAVMPGSARKWHASPRSSRTALRNSSTQTASDKSTQTRFPYSPDRQRASSDHKH